MDRDGQASASDRGTDRDGERGAQRLCPHTHTHTHSVGHSHTNTDKHAHTHTQREKKKGERESHTLSCVERERESCSKEDERKAKRAEREREKTWHSGLSALLRNLSPFRPLSLPLHFVMRCVSSTKRNFHERSR